MDSAVGASELARVFPGVGLGLPGWALIWNISRACVRLGIENKRLHVEMETGNVDRQSLNRLDPSQV